jgi:hypothetical protein
MEPWTDRKFYDLLTGSYRRILGEELVPADQANEHGPEWLYESAPFCVLAHNTAENPIFIYGNRKAQTCFDYTWDELTSLPSHLSTEFENREERERLLERVKRDKFATGYRGLRIAKGGKRFWIEDVTVWQLIDENGTLHGQAAVYRRWRDA